MIEDLIEDLIKDLIGDLIEDYIEDLTEDVIEDLVEEPEILVQPHIHNLGPDRRRRLCCSGIGRHLHLHTPACLVHA